MLFQRCVSPGLGDRLWLFKKAKTAQTARFVQADLNHCWVNMSESTFSYVSAHLNPHTTGKQYMVWERMWIGKIPTGLSALSQNTSKVCFIRLYPAGTHRCIDVDATLYKRYVLIGYILISAVRMVSLPHRTVAEHDEIDIL